MIKLLVIIIAIIIIVLVNKRFMKKNESFFPIVPLIISCVITIISIVQIIQKENEYLVGEVQTIQIEEREKY